MDPVCLPKVLTQEELEAIEEEKATRQLRAKVGGSFLSRRALHEGNNADRARDY